MTWAKYIVCVGALMGIFTTTLIGVLGSSAPLACAAQQGPWGPHPTHTEPGVLLLAARILVGCCRERMLPPVIASGW